MPFGRKHQPPPEPVSPPSLGDVERALREIAGERAEINRWLAAFSSRRTELLEQGAADDAIGAHQAERAAHELALARLGPRERQLAQQAEWLRGQAHAEQWQALRARYLDAAQTLVERIGSVFDAIDEVNAIRSNAPQSQAQLLPSPPAPTALGGLAYFKGTLRSVQETPPPAAAPPDLTAVRMLRHMAGLNPGEAAGFPADRAWHLVEAGFATWSGEPPPRPPAARITVKDAIL